MWEKGFFYINHAALLPRSYYLLSLGPIYLYHQHEVFSDTRETNLFLPLDIHRYLFRAHLRFYFR